MIKKKSDGTTYYYYYKRKPGPKKKRGRKKFVEKVKKVREPIWLYKIIWCVDNKQREVISSYRTLDDVNDAIKVLEDKNKQILFPKKNINCRNKKGTKPFKSEYVILERSNEPSPTFLRNDYGKLISHTTTSDRWKIYNKFPRNIEETFWVYGFNPLSDRKDCLWIKTNLIDDSDEYVRICVYGNKIVFRYDQDCEIVICKNKTDCIQLYNTLEKFYEHDKTVIFTGLATPYSERANYIVDIIQKKTGWNKKKIFSSTSKGN